MIVRALTADDWPVLREIRLRALADAPDAFTSTVHRERAFTDDVWRERTVNAAIAFVGDTAVGLVSGITHEGNMHVVGMWVAPDARGRGAGRALLDWVVERGRAAGAELVTLDFIEGNEPARRLYEGAGFTPVGPSFPVPTDPTRRQIAMSISLGPWRTATRRPNLE